MITFKDIKQNNPVYILDKSALEIKQGKVTATAPHIDNTFNTMATGQMMRDVTIESEGKSTTYTIPENLMVTFAGDIVLATEQQGLATEVERMKSEAEAALAAVDRHKALIEKSGELLARLNPQVRERQETERRFKSIEGDINGIKGMVQKLLDKLA